MPWGSNFTFMVWIDIGSSQCIRAIYKPRDGERPLYDFPRGTLYRREYATFLLSRALGWPKVPLTLIREGPYGIGSMQLYIESDPRITYFDLHECHGDVLSQFAIFDLLVNNADRKAGHCLLDKNGEIWSIDHGLTFHQDFKLRTVMLELYDRTICPALLTDLTLLLHDLDSSSSLAQELSQLLIEQEIIALKNRLLNLTQNPILPPLDPYQNVPWPWI